MLDNNRILAFTTSQKISVNEIPCAAVGGTGTQKENSVYTNGGDVRITIEMD